jgi:polyhydroxyalkanoate synthesis regulator phasin
MPRDDRFKKYQEAGADFLEMARTRAEEFLTELAKMGGSSQKQAQGAFDEMIESSRRGTEQILNVIRAEIAAQFSLLGVATRQELGDLERRLTTKIEGSGKIEASGSSAPAAKKAGRVKKAAAKKAGPARMDGPAITVGPATTAGPAEKTGSKKAGPKKAGPKKAGPKKAGPSTETGPAKNAGPHAVTGED